MRSKTAEHALVVIPDGGGVPETLFETSRRHGLDPYRVRLAASGRGLALIARGEVGPLEAAAQALAREGTRCATVSDEETRSLPRLQVAGGIAAEGESVSLRVHGKAVGPPEGVALLFLLADLGREDGPLAAARPRPRDTFAQRLRRAVFPVVDVVWQGGRIRLPLRGMAWRGLPGAQRLSGPLNLIHLLETLAKRSAGATLDMGFQGQDLAVEVPPPAEESVEGADREQTTFFDRYSAAAAALWAKGLYPPATPGHLTVVSGDPTPIEPKRYLSAPRTAPTKSPIPWIRKGKKSRTRWLLWPWLAAGPVLALRSANPTVGAAVLLICGVVAGALGLRALRRREHIRAVPQARVRSLAMGPVELFGRVVPCARFLAPFSRKPCGWYLFEIRERRLESKSGEASQAVETGGSGDIPFRLDDGTGSVLVQPSGAEVDVPSERIEIDFQRWAVEWILEEGGEYFVAGVAQRRPPETDWNELLLEKVRAVKRDGDALARYGLAPGEPGSAEAWERVRADIERQAHEEVAARASERDDVFIGSSSNVPFLISRRSRREETARLTRDFVVGSFLGAIYVVVAVILWLS